MAALEYAYTLAKQASPFPKCCTGQNATGAHFLEVQIPPRILVYDWDPWMILKSHAFGRYGYLTEICSLNV